MNVSLAGKPEAHEQFNEYARDLQSRNLTVILTRHQSGALASMLEHRRQWKENRTGPVMMAFTGQQPTHFSPFHVLTDVVDTTRIHGVVDKRALFEKIFKLAAVKRTAN